MSSRKTTNQREKSSSRSKYSKSSSQNSTTLASSGSSRKSTTLASSGYLLTCDPPTKQFIKNLNEKKHDKFKIDELDETHLLVKDKGARDEILRHVEDWMNDNIYENVHGVGEHLDT
mmetsp:Transcript_11941/g.14028  ORF Transcript_11941/g.14028 Transcript_11941/m.14028 type:complete len:117 (-) Transcript_11941:68-418(-)